MGKNQLETKEKRLSKEADYEDAALKTAMQYFGEVLLPLLGIREKPIRPLPTESVHLELKRMEEDFNYLVEGEKIYHFEFQSKNGGRKDLRRFRRYEVAIADTYGMEVVTYVVFTGNVKHPMTELKEGINTYRIVPITMSGMDGDEVLADIRRMRAEGQHPDRKLLASTALTPLMGGQSSVGERIREAFQVIRQEESCAAYGEETKKLQAVLYAFASKFLDKAELEEIKEMVGMTLLGEMLIEQGWVAGKAEGEERVGKLNLLLLEQKQYEELERASRDKNYREQLFKKFQI